MPGSVRLARDLDALRRTSCSYGVLICRSPHTIGHVRDREAEESIPELRANCVSRAGGRERPACG